MLSLDLDVKTMVNTGPGYRLPVPPHKKGNLSILTILLHVLNCFNTWNVLYGFVQKRFISIKTPSAVGDRLGSGESNVTQISSQKQPLERSS